MFRKGGESTSVKQGGRRKVHTTYPDGAEMIEEFDLKTDELLVRRRRGRTTLGKDTPWEYLVGEAPRTFAPDTGTLIESGANPSFTRSQDAPGSFVWRVRNLPYPKETYDVRCDHEAQQVVIRTSNKKYFKRFEVPELKLLDKKLEDAALSWDYRNFTLIVQYKKPREAVVAEIEEKKDRMQLAAKKTPEEGDVDCKQQ
jgi:hypothetical protein